jgi:hypothetical protein
MENFDQKVRCIPVSLPYIGRRDVGPVNQSSNQMRQLNQQGRRTFRWPGVAREMVKAHLKTELSQRTGQGAQTGLKALITRIAAVSGNPREACWRFVRQSGVISKRSYRQWTRAEQQKLLDLIASRSLAEVTTLLHRSPTSVRAMLHRLGASARMGQDWFTKYTLAEALHVRAEEVQKWIDRGLLRSRIVEAGGLQRQIIAAEDFCDFCQQHRGEIMGRRLNPDRLSFVQTFVFPPSHMELLPVRKAKKEQAAYDEQMKKESGWEADADDELGATA